jgi:hypothetical protein
MEVKIQKKTIIFLIFLEIALLIILFSFFPKDVLAGTGSPNITVITNLTVGNAFPEIANVSIENNVSNLALTPNTTRKIYCWGNATDYNGWDDIKNASATFFENATSSYGAANDNNVHYFNDSCTLTQTGTYTDAINCSLDIWYYANPGIWNCTLNATDNAGKSGYGWDTINISTLLALGLPDFIYYGIVNATEISEENITNITNYGNVKINLSLSGYGFTANDNNSMNCTLGAIKNISIMYEKYNLTASTPGVLNFTQFNSSYTNLTSSPIVKRFNLDFRQNDTINDAINTTYWRIYVPVGVAGTCQGNIVFGATIANGTG